MTYPYGAQQPQPQPVQPQPGWPGQQPQPQYPPQQQAQPQQPMAAGGYVPQPQAQPQQPRAASMNDIIQPGDPNFPAELHGRRISEAMGYYNAARRAMVQNAEAARQANANRGYQGQPQPQQQQNGASGFLADPEGAMRRVVGEMIAPVVNRTMEQQIAEAGQQARQILGEANWQLLQSELPAALQGMPRESLTNPDAWLTAGDFLLGRMQRTGRLQQQSQAQAPQQQPTQTQQSWNNYEPASAGYPPPQQPQAQQFRPNPAGPPTPQAQPQPQPYQFYAEQPTGGGQAMQQPGFADPRLAAKREAARRFGMPFEEYMQWDNGNVPPMAQPQQQVPLPPTMPPMALPAGMVWQQTPQGWVAVPSVPVAQQQPYQPVAQPTQNGAQRPWVQQPAPPLGREYGYGN